MDTDPMRSQEFLQTVLHGPIRKSLEAYIRLLLHNLYTMVTL